MALAIAKMSFVPVNFYFRLSLRLRVICSHHCLSSFAQNIQTKQQILRPAISNKGCKPAILENQGSNYNISMTNNYSIASTKCHKPLEMH